MPFVTNVIIDTDVLEATRQAIKAAPGVFSERVRVYVLPKIQDLVDARLKVAPGPVVYPFIFGTAKSRRAFFATRGFGRGIPTPRTGETENAWVVKLDLRRGDGLIQILNRSRAAGYVYGSGTVLGTFRQIQGHKNTGWGATLDDDLIYIAEQTNNYLIDEWYAVVSGDQATGQVEGEGAR